MEGQSCLCRPKLAEDGHLHGWNEAPDKGINVLFCELGAVWDGVVPSGGAETLAERRGGRGVRRGQGGRGEGEGEEGKGKEGDD